MRKYISGLIILILSITSVYGEDIEDILDGKSSEIINEPAPTYDIPALINRLESLESRMNELEQIVSKSNQVVPTQKITNTEKKNEKIDTSSGNEKKDYDRALSTFKDNDFSLSIDLFAEFVNDYPNSKLLSNAYFWQGESYFRQQMFDQASVCFFQGYKKAPKGSKASDSLLKLATSLSEIGKVKEACVTLDKLNKEFPKRTVVSMKKGEEIYKKLGCKK